MIQAEFRKRRKRDETVMCRIGVSPIKVSFSNQCHSTLRRVSKANSTPYVKYEVLISDLLPCVSKGAHKSIHYLYFFLLTVLNVTSPQTTRVIWYNSLLFKIFFLFFFFFFFSNKRDKSSNAKLESA